MRASGAWGLEIAADNWIYILCNKGVSLLGPKQTYENETKTVHHRTHYWQFLQFLI